MTDNRTLTRLVYIGCGMLYSLIFFHFTYPLCTNFNDAVISGFRDAHVFLWNIDTFTELARSGQNPFYTDRACHPLGVWLTMHTYAPLTGLVNLVVNNPALTLNVVTFLNFVLSAIGGMLLFRSFTPNWPLAFLSGFIFAFCPFKMTHLFAGQYNLVMTAPIPFYVLCMRKSCCPATAIPASMSINRRYVVRCIILLFMELLCDYYLTYYLLLFTAAYIAFYRFGIGTWNRKTLLVATIIIGASGYVAVGALELADIRQHGLYTSADVISYVVPSAFSHFFGNSYVNFVRSEVIKGGPLENITEIGLAPFLLFILFLSVPARYRFGPASKELLFLILFFFIIATPVVNIAGRPVAVLPSAILHYIPFVNNFRVASRATLMIMLFLPITGLLFLHFRFFATGRYKTGIAAAATVFAVLYLQYLPAPFPLLTAGETPSVYRSLPASDNGTVLELPFGIESGRGINLGAVNTFQMVYQTVHHKNVLGGYLSRLPADLPGFYRNYPFASTLLDLMRTGKRKAPLPATGETEAFLRDFHIRYAIIYPGYGRSAAGEYARAAFSNFIMHESLIDGYTLLTLKPVSGPPRHPTAQHDSIRHPHKKRNVPITAFFEPGKPRMRKGPMHQLQAARDALDRARNAGADTIAPELYFGARQLVDEAEAEIGDQHDMPPFVRDFTLAKTLLDSATGAARRAEAAASAASPEIPH